jgi:hypothetical protein
MTTTKTSFHFTWLGDWSFDAESYHGLASSPFHFAEQTHAEGVTQIFLIVHYNTTDAFPHSAFAQRIK